jgi:hypothetical protein
MFDGEVPSPECDACEQSCPAHALSPAETGRMICPACKAAEDAPTCAYCGGPHTREYAIHRDGFCQGPQVPLCNRCGGRPKPTERQIWARIATL